MPNFLYPFLFVAITLWVGLPWAAFFIRRGEGQLSQLFFHALIAGLPTLGLAAKIAWTLGRNATEAAGKFLLLVNAVNGAILWTRRRHRASLARSEKAGLLGLLAVLALLLSVFAANMPTPARSGSKPDLCGRA